MMTARDTISTLNSLIATTLDSADGYRKAAEKAESPAYREMFAEYAGEREQIVRDLQAQVRAQGGQPEDDGSILASAHRAFLSLRDALTGSDDAAVIREVERGEDHIKAKYEAALVGELSGECATAVRAAYDSVCRGHDRMSALKHSLEGGEDTARYGAHDGSYADASRVGFADRGSSVPSDPATKADSPRTVGTDTGGRSGGAVGGW